MKNVLYFLITISYYLPSAQSLSVLYREGIQAYDSGNIGLFKSKMEEIDRKRPNYPAVVYNLARAYALEGSPAKAIETLNSYLLMDASQNLNTDEDLKSLKEYPDFKDLLNHQKLLSNEIPVSHAYKWKLQQSHPEAITYSDKQKTYYIGGVNDGKIWKIEDNKEPSQFADTTEDSWAIMGLAIDPDEKYLWVCTSSLKQYGSYNPNLRGNASVLQYDIATATLIRKYILKGDHTFGDLIISSNEDIYVSDSRSNKLYWISKNSGELTEFYDLSDRTFNLQGITFNKDETAIFLSDYIDGIYKLTLDKKQFTKLKIAGDNILIKGIDGLYFRDNYLIGLHNGTTPNRIVKYFLNEYNSSIIGKKILAQAGVLDEPTQGVLVDGKFHFISNSPWGAYDRDNNFSPKTDFLIIGTLE